MNGLMSSMFAKLAVLQDRVGRINRGFAIIFADGPHDSFLGLPFTAMCIEDFDPTTAYSIPVSLTSLAGD